MKKKKRKEKKRRNEEFHVFRDTHHHASLSHSINEEPENTFRPVELSKVGLHHDGGGGLWEWLVLQSLGEGSFLVTHRSV